MSFKPNTISSNTHIISRFAMFSAFFTIKLKIILILSLLLASVNAITITSPIIGILAVILFLYSSGKMIGSNFTKNPIKQIIVGSLTIISSVSIIGAGLYYLMPIQPWMFWILILTISGISIKISKYTNLKQSIVNKVEWLTLLLFSILAFIWFQQIQSFVITESIRSPWNIIPIELLVILFLMFCIALSTLWVNRFNKISIILLTISIFSAISIVAITYPIGFGFDPFIHEATVSHIAEYGTITPKPLYYIGQYALQITGLYIFSIPISMGKFLLPIFASIFLTGTAWIGFESLFSKKYNFAIASIIIIPLSELIITTPQGLAYIFVASLVFLSLMLFKKNHIKNWAIILLLLIATLTIHPLAGIPAFFYCLLIFIATSNLQKNKKTILIILSSTIGAIIMPIIFLLQAKISNLQINFTPSGLFNLEKLQLSGFFANRTDSLMDAMYLFIDNQIWIILSLAFLSIFFLRKQKIPKGVYIPLIMSMICLINFWLLAGALEFEFLVEYERLNYANRLLNLATIFALPAVGITFAGIYQNVRKKSIILPTSIIIILSFLATANVYGAYPRHDNYARSAGFNTSQSDIDAVWTINKLGGNKNYIVLANQSLSAAALQEFGFARYYENDIFYYPIPTGGELYNYFLKMADNEPEREIILDVMDKTKTDIGFFVLHNYWWDSARIKEHAKQNADDWLTIGDNEITIFIYYR